MKKNSPRYQKLMDEVNRELDEKGTRRYPFLSRCRCKELRERQEKEPGIPWQGCCFRHNILYVSKDMERRLTDEENQYKVPIHGTDTKDPEARCHVAL